MMSQGKKAFVFRFSFLIFKFMLLSRWIRVYFCAFYVLIKTLHFRLRRSRTKAIPYSPCIARKRPQVCLVLAQFFIVAMSQCPVQCHVPSLFERVLHTGPLFPEYAKAPQCSGWACRQWALCAKSLSWIYSTDNCNRKKYTV